MIGPYQKKREGIEVEFNECKNFDEMIKKFKKKVSKSGILKEVKEKMAYIKPSDRRRRKKALGIKNAKLINELNNLLEE